MTTVTVPEGIQEFLAEDHRMFISSKWLDALSGETFDVVDPATTEVIASVPSAGAADVDRAVSAARAAFDDGPWRRLGPSERGRLVWRLADLIEEHTEEFAVLDSLDNGKPVTATRAVDVPLSVDLFRYMAGWATKIEGNTISCKIPGQPDTNFFSYTLRQPVGVVAQIIPWNYPLMMAAYKLAPALAAGCTTVLKPAEQTPLSALLLGRLIKEAGFPDGVVNVVTGFGETAGVALSSHPGVDKVSFTGSTEVGRDIVRRSAGNLKRVSLELGGKSPNLIFADADLATSGPGCRRRHLLQPRPGLLRRLTPLCRATCPRRGRGGHRQKSRADPARTGPGSRHRHGPPRVRRATGSRARLHRQWS